MLLVLHQGEYVAMGPCNKEAMWLQTLLSLISYCRRLQPHSLQHMGTISYMKPSIPLMYQHIDIQTHYYWDHGWGTRHQFKYVQHPQLHQCTYKGLPELAVHGDVSFTCKSNGKINIPLGECEVSTHMDTHSMVCLCGVQNLFLCHLSHRGRGKNSINILTFHYLC